MSLFRFFGVAVTGYSALRFGQNEELRHKIFQGVNITSHNFGVNVATQIKILESMVNNFCEGNFVQDEPPRPKP